MRHFGPSFKLCSGLSLPLILSHLSLVSVAVGQKQEQPWMNPKLGPQSGQRLC